MILAFIVLLTRKKLTVYSALTLTPVVFGLIVCWIFGKDFLDIFDWIKSGVFYSVNPTTKAVKMGVVSSVSLILFAVLYFGVMLKAGLFDPLCIFFIRKAKGDPLKVTIATVMVASMVTLDGDTTTTIIVCLAAFLGLYKQMGLKLSYLAILITMPIGIFNQLPWGGPLVAAATALNVDMGILFRSILPGMLVAEAYTIFAAYLIGKKERKRLNYNPEDKSKITDEHIEEMVSAVKNFEPDFKRPKLFFINLLLTIVILGMLIGDMAHGGMLFMVGAALALTINYGVDEQMTLLRDSAGDVLIPALATFAAGAFTGILGNSGMSKAIANSIISIIPESLGMHIAPIYAIIAAPAICFLPQDAFYYGIATLMAPVALQFGISTEQIAVASMVGQAFRLASPVIPAVYILCDRTNMNFISYQKLFFSWTWPVLIIYLVVHTLTGAMPF